MGIEDVHMSIHGYTKVLHMGIYAVQQMPLKCKRQVFVQIQLTWQQLP